MKLRALVDTFLQAVYPPRCVFCGGPLESGAICCHHCRETVKPHPQVRQFVLSDGTPLQCYTLYNYDDPVRCAIHDLKFHDRKEVGASLGLLMAADPKARNLAHTAECLVPVPISRKRRAERGYNQSELIAKTLTEQCGVDCLSTEVLEKFIHNEEQSALGLLERKENAAGVYRLRKTADVRGKFVLLLDDVVTTGSTLCACAEALYEAGAALVMAAAFASATLSEQT